MKQKYIPINVVTQYIKNKYLLHLHERNEGVHESFQSFTSAVISATFECPSCEKVFRSLKLQEHIDHEHAEENSRTSAGGREGASPPFVLIDQIVHLLPLA